MHAIKRSILCLFLSLCFASNAQSADLPWKNNTPIVKVTKELYVKHPAKGVSAWVDAYYVGPGLVREERHSTMASSDTPKVPKRRRSPDDGRTWSDFETMPPIVTHEKTARIFWAGCCRYYDPETKITVRIWLRQTKVKGTYHNQLFARLSRDLDKTWGPPRQLTYEPGKIFDPADPLNKDYLDNNQAYTGNNIIRHSNGTLIHAAAAVNVPYPTQKGKTSPRPIGSLCFIGKWNAGSERYDWSAGKPVFLPVDVSSRGLMEPEVAELADGRVLVIWRGSNARLDPAKVPGRKWFSVSTDGGKTLSKVQDLRYDDGSRFFSPSAIHRMIRHSITKKLYWVANVTGDRTSGNSPRYPLIIAEIDETKPAVKKNTVTLIDDRGPNDSSRLQLSNFALFENRQTKQLEIYLTRLGADANDFWGADAYKYTLTLE